MTLTRRTFPARLAALGAGFLAGLISHAAAQENDRATENSAAPPAAYQFSLTVSGGDEADAIAFSEVSGFSTETAPSPAAEGDENRFVHKLPKGVTHSNLVLKYGVAPANSALLQWIDATMSANDANAIEPRELILTLKDQSGAPLRAWSFSGAWPVNIERYQAAETGETPIRSLAFAYQYSARTQ